jgi:hypothetical protein
VMGWRVCGRMSVTLPQLLGDATTQRQTPNLKK